MREKLTFVDAAMRAVVGMLWAGLLLVLLLLVLAECERDDGRWDDGIIRGQDDGRYWSAPARRVI